MTNGCLDCFKEVRSRNDILAQTKLNAKALAQKEQKAVAVYQAGSGFEFGILTEGTPPPSGTVDLIMPSQGSEDGAVHTVHVL